MRKFPRRQHIKSVPLESVAIPGFPKYYATPQGEIYSCHERRINRRRFGRNGAGYPICGMKDEAGRMRFPLVHRIIAKLFVPGDHSLTVNHKDMDKTNARAENLEWITFSANHFHGRQNRPEWTEKIGRANSVPVIATNIKTGEETCFPSMHAAGEAMSAMRGAAANICNAVRTGGAAYGFRWRKEKAGEAGKLSS